MIYGISILPRITNILCITNVCMYNYPLLIFWVSCGDIPRMWTNSTGIVTGIILLMSI